MNVFAQAQAGDPDALALLVRRHLPLVRALSGRFSSREDAFQQGCLGLLYAIRHFQEEKGFSFSTYAVPQILGSMRRSVFHVLGWRSRAALNKARAYQEQCIRQTGRQPGIRETAAHAGIPPEELAWLLETDRGPVYDETGDFLVSLPDPRGDAWLLRFCVRDILERMPRQESYLLRQRYYAGRSQTDLARELRLSPSRVSRREARARRDFRLRWLEGEC